MIERNRDPNGARTAGDRDRPLTAGYWILQVKSMEEAIEWLRRSPFKKGNETLEIRRVFEAEDFPDMTPELRAREDSLRARSTKN